MIDNEKYKKQIEDIEYRQNLLMDEKYDVIITWKNELKKWLSDNKDDDGFTYVKKDDKIFYCVKELSSTIIRGGGRGFGKTCENIFGGVLLRGFSFNPTVLTIKDCFRTETKIDITDTFEKIEKKEFLTELDKTIEFLFLNTTENINFQYENFPYYLEQCIERNPEFLNRKEVTEMKMILDTKLLDENEIF